MHQPTLHCDFALPAEWEPQSAIMLTWPHAGGPAANSWASARRRA